MNTICQGKHLWKPIGVCQGLIVFHCNTCGNCKKGHANYIPITHPDDVEESVPITCFRKCGHRIVHRDDGDLDE